MRTRRAVTMIAALTLLLALERNLKDHLDHEFGAENRRRYWTIFEALRAELGYADYLGALQRYRLEDLNDPKLLLMSSFLVDYPSVCAEALSGCARCHQASAQMGLDGNPLGWRCSVPAAQGPARGTMGSRRRPRTDLHP